VRISIILVAVLLLPAALAHAQAPSPLCWEVVPSGQGTLPTVFLKVNKCTGETWVLIRTPVKADNPQAFTWRWFPLSNDSQGEPILNR
jgi:hypothetical protein